MSEQEDESIVTSRVAKVLVVDDSESARNLLKRRLAMYKYEILPAANQERASEILAKHPVDVILLNMYLDRESSYDFLVSLKEDASYKAIPIIMVSNEDDMEMVVKCIEAGAEDYMAKPLNQTLLRARLANCVARKEAYDKEVAYLAKIEQGQKQIVAQEKMASVGVLVSSISQELKNPLNFVINFSGVSAEICGELIEKVKAHNQHLPADFFKFIMGHLEKFQSNVAKISEYGKNADQILRFMLDQSSASDGKKHPSNINRVISQTITMIQASYKGNGFTTLPLIKTEFNKTLPHVSISVQAMSKAIYNLLDNALYSLLKKYENLSLANITIKTEEITAGIEISIRDNGSGIKPNIIEKIFNPFFTTKPEGTGPGLGLSSAKEVVEDHNGTISVNSKEGEFAEFKIMIPK